MTEKEVADLLLGLSARYPNFKPDNIVATRKAWFQDLKDYSIEQVMGAFSIYRSTNSTGFAPSVDQLLNCMHKIDDMTQMSAIEAWGLVSKAVRDSGYHAQEQYDRLPELIKGLVTPAQLHNWSQTDLLVLESTIAKQFQISYEIAAKREREAARLPLEMRARLEALTNNTLAALPQWENPIPVVQATIDNSRATEESIDSYMMKLKERLDG